MSDLFVDRYPDQARVVRAAFTTAYIALGIGALFGALQALHRTDILRLVESTTYYTILTGHGVFLVISFTIFFLVGLYQWAVTDSLNRGPVDMRLTWTWYGLMSIGTLLAGIAILAGFLDDPPSVLGSELSADVLFTFYAPLQANPIFYIGLVLFVVGTWLAGADWFRTWWAWKKENPGERIPLPTFMVLTTMIMWYISSIGVAVAILAFILPWSLGLIDSLNPTLTRTLFWYFGHPVVYFWLLPAYMLWYIVLPKLSGGRLFSDPLARVVFILFVLLSTPVGIHHQYLDPGISEGFKYIVMTNTMFLLLPSLLTAFTVVASMEHGARQRGGEGTFNWLRALPWRDPAFTGMALAGLVFAFGGFTGIVNAGMNINYLVHNSLWVPGHIHTQVGTAVALTFMAGSYWLIPQLTGNRLVGRQLALVQVVLWFVGIVFMTNSMYRGGLIGIPRRTAEPQYSFDYEIAVGSIPELRAQLAIGGMLLFISALLFLTIILLTAFNNDSIPVVDGTIPPALSGPEDSPRILDDLRVWIAIALVLIVIAYAFPLANIVSRGGLFGPDIGPFPVIVETLTSLPPVADASMYLETVLDGKS
ncbi:ba3-type terminal oxidase subunit I (plasmid) [Natrialba magadii ATCC 43099]|uniref:Ba3-type terminal oxidase subunit I n=1 Tax=Natrialba magadii (strain ATCC 43099 / DSM 3394 / CCM 3739 / CIP 104546 / IAM 13178 / JCM 8861 / NBRC 102185 / NCIMB 2190 / MS3) TaxID=547559 RepID=D3T185_NATMM|nr:b(o/a)3-type cytochrome-c oxidase subunit 1 [Natrialba magadii]ADD07344.1 ba3-type terminal oxidase subunit I [Natrialba magadii ATCC 43099]ELY32600.1 cytochrome c oxidase subunit I [Natrialba magadii ATCC 43099]